jgi:hypothetical protein
MPSDVVLNVGKDMSFDIDPVPDVVLDVVGNVELSHSSEDMRVAKEPEAVVWLFDIEVNWVEEALLLPVAEVCIPPVAVPGKCAPIPDRDHDTP